MTNWDSYEEVNAFVMDHEDELIRKEIAFGLACHISETHLGRDEVLIEFSNKHFSVCNIEMSIADLKKLGTEVIDDNDNGFRRDE